MIPKYIFILAKCIPLIKYENSINLATGEIKEFKNTSSIAKKNGLIELKDNYTILWNHIIGNYYKEVSKTFDDRTC